MSGTIEFRVLELINARLCHELVSPVGAINNGVELLDDEDPDFVRDAIQLIGQSARKAGQRLQFYRFAYGTTAASSSGAGSGRDLASGLLEGGKVRCDWSSEAATLPVDWQRLACNMLVLAAETLPRGGVILVRPLRAGASGIEVAAEGESVNISPDLRAALDPAVAVDQLTSRTVHAYFTAHLARQLGAAVVLAEAEPQRVLFRAAAG
ncbi:MAG TPA: histidine phosphotransferase family protein [Stellaceae bacterium]|nr:histidine phosphotransferase family protein [Stellaceae bacterium]